MRDMRAIDNRPYEFPRKSNIIRKIALNLISDFKKLTDSKKPVSGVMRSCLFDVDFLDDFIHALAYHNIMNNLFAN